VPSQTITKPSNNEQVLTHLLVAHDSLNITQLHSMSSEQTMLHLQCNFALDEPSIRSTKDVVCLDDASEGRILLRYDT
jgi:hypothetical protein